MRPQKISFFKRILFGKNKDIWNNGSFKELIYPFSEYVMVFLSYTKYFKALMQHIWLLYESWELICCFQIGGNFNSHLCLCWQIWSYELMMYVYIYILSIIWYFIIGNEMVTRTEALLRRWTQYMVRARARVG